MKKVTNLIIGFGKGGKTLATILAKAKQSVVLVEANEMMFGGTCINVACIPTKTLEYSSRIAKLSKNEYSIRNSLFKEAMNEKKILIEKLRLANYQNLVNNGVEVIVGTAHFISDHTVSIKKKDNTQEEIEASRIFINTGSSPFIPDIPGLKESKYAFTSEKMLSINQLPKNLVILGGGYIGLEFASMFTNFGSNVTILQDGNAFIPKEDIEISNIVEKDFESRGINIIKNVTTTSIVDNDLNATIQYTIDNVPQEIQADAILIATGRRANVQSLQLQNTTITLTKRNAIETNEHLETNAKNVYALGDVTGGLQFTYISLDDSRIVLSNILANNQRTTLNRGNIPYTVFIDPPLSRIGLTESEAQAKGYTIKIAKMEATLIPKTKILRNTPGLIKVIIDANTNQILGAHLYCADSQEMINLLKLAMDQAVPYTVLRDSIYTHPSMSEAFNELFQ